MSAESFATEWLEQRVDLWRRICLPSIASQTVEDFTWMVFCDESTERSAVEALRSFERELPMLEVVITGADRTPADAVRSRLTDEDDVLVTTWLDSDDAVADRFVETIQAYAEPFAHSAYPTLVLNFPRGYRFDLASGELYEDRMINSPFPSLFERPRRARPQTVLETSHVMLPHLNPSQHDESLHAWLISIHGGNLVNRIDARNRPALLATGAVPGFPAISRS